MSSTIEKGLDFTLGVAVLTAEALDQVINGLVEKGKVARENAPAVFDAVMERGRPAREQFVRAVKEDVLPQLKRSGTASNDEIRALEERVTALETQVNAASTAPQMSELPEQVSPAQEPMEDLSGTTQSEVEAEVGGAVELDTPGETYTETADAAAAPEIVTEAAEVTPENERTGDASA